MYLNLTINKAIACHLFPKDIRKGGEEQNNEGKKEKRKEGRRKEKEKNLFFPESWKGNLSI